MKRILLLLPLLVACSSKQEITRYLTPYKIDVRQGNLVTQEMVAQLRPGLNRDQVRFILGTPLVADMFHSDRWDYVYRFQPGRGELQQRTLTVFFENNVLVRVAGDVVADDSGKTEQQNPASKVIEVPRPAAEGAANPTEKK